MKGNHKKGLSYLLLFSMLISQLPVQAAEVKLENSQEEDFFKSEEEFVYLNSYNDKVRTQNFDRNWKFYLGDAGDAQDPAFDDSAWENISLPHDYSITREYSKSGEAESAYLPGGTGWYRKRFSVSEAPGKRVRIDFGGVYMNAAVYINGHKLGTHPYGYTPFSFDLTDYLNGDKENIIAVKVENEIPSSRWYSGSGLYRSVELTITDPVHVDLYGTKIETPDLETEQGGDVTVSINTALKNDGVSPVTVTLEHSVIPKETPWPDNAIGTAKEPDITIAPGGSKSVTATLMASSPQLWSLSDPSLYLLRTQVIKDGQVSDTYDTEFGFRYMKFDPDTGFSLNGTKMKLKGVCMHHDQGALGSAAYYRALERQVEILKEMGSNSIRVTHNPADRKLIEICNEKGMLVVEEAYDTWLYPKNGNVNDYASWFETPIEADNAVYGAAKGMTWGEFDLKAFMKRDYNAPSLIMYSLGNEVMEGLSGGIDYSRYPITAQKLIDWTVATDSTRPVTIGDNKLKAGWKEAKDIGDRLTAAGGAVGFNYPPGSGENSLDWYHRENPDWLIYGSEAASAINSRSVYSFRGNVNSPEDFQRTAYDESRVVWGHMASDAWYTVVTRDFMAGEFVWTGFDYLGEPTPWNGTGPGPVTAWPSPKSSYFGIVDTAGFPKDSYYLYKSQWDDAVHTLHILPAWNGNVVSKENGKVKVVVYSDAPSVELFFTPKGSGTPRSLGRKTFTKKTTAAGYTYQIYEGEGKSPTEHENLYLYWLVPYADGTITARAYTDGTGTAEITDTVGRSSVTTADVPSALSVSADRTELVSDGQDLAYITVEVKDRNGNLIPAASDRITFSVEGEGRLIGVDNGNSPDHDSYQANNRKAFGGKALAIVRSTREAGSFTLTASAPGLDSSSVTVTTSHEPGNTDTEDITGYQLSRYYYVKTGTMPSLPSNVTVRRADGRAGTEEAAWTDIREEDIQKPGSFTVTGRLKDNIPLTVTINMIDDIAALLNYSCAVPAGSRPVLPAARPAVMENGRLLNVQFPVTWEGLGLNRFDTPGMVQINGTSHVFGKEYEVTARIRVSEEKVEVGSNVAGKALTLLENTPGDQRSDTLAAVVDGSTALAPGIGEGLNASIWSNRRYAQNGGRKSEITLSYATAERLAQAVIYFFEDESGAGIPERVELFYSKGGTSDSDWIEIPAEAAAGAEKEGVIPYTYPFLHPVDAVLFKISLTNSGEALGNGRKPYTGITEIQLKRAVGSFTVYSDARLRRLTVNGNSASEASLNKGSYSTPALFADTIEAEGMHNGAVTILSPYEDTANIIIESEDHTKRAVFRIHLDGKEEQDPGDGSRDYATSKTTASAPNSQVANGMTPDKAVDGDAYSIWHTKWGYMTPLKDRWIMLQLDAPVKLDAIRYLPKSGSESGDNNGRIREYRVEVSEDGSHFKTVAAGNWPDLPGWKLAVFDEPVTAGYVRLYGVHTYGDEAKDKYVNAAEVHARTALPAIDLSAQALASMDFDEFEQTGAGAPVKPAVHLTVDGVPLRYGLDYTVSYENNTKPGTATAKIKGILKYSGSVSVKYTILEKNSQEISVAGGLITHIDNQPYHGGAEAKAAAGHVITVSAAVLPEGKTFSHWRVIPSATEIIGAGKPVTTLLVPEHACRLIAMYRDGDGATGSAAALSKSIPDSWFAYGDENALEILLAEVLTEEDRRSVLQGGQVEVIMSIQKSEAAPNPSALFTGAASGKASPSNAGDAASSPSNALKSAAKFGSPEELGGLTAGFFIRTELHKVTKRMSGTSTVKAAAKSKVKLTFQLPEKDRDMMDYTMIPYGKDEVFGPQQAIVPEINGNLVSFEAAANGIYALCYTLCHRITFVDYDGRVISLQRVPHGDTAAAPDAPYQKGYAFTGWSKDFDSVTKDMTVKAIYQKLREPEKNKNGLNKPYTGSGRRKLRDNKAKKKTYDPIHVTRGAWVPDADGWKFRLSDGSYPSDQWVYIRYRETNEWYRFDGNGRMVTEWFKEPGGALYYLDPGRGIGNGRLFTGWHWITGLDGANRCYYFQQVSDGTRGKLLTKTKTPDGYTVNENGEWTVDGEVQTKKH